MELQLGISARRGLRSLGWVIAGAVLLCLPAIWNGFPLVYSDTGAYLATAFEGKVPLARPTGYGLFVRYASLGGSLWLAVVLQSLLFSAFLVRVVQVVLPAPARWLSQSSAMLVSIGLTGMAWYGSQLMPDIFTGLVAIGFFLLLYDREMQWPWKMVIAFALYWFCFSHYSHAAMLLLLVGLWAAVAIVQKMRRRSIGFSVAGLVWALLPTLFAMFSFYYVNYSNGFGWRMTRSSHVFTMARLSETGLLKDYLEETCSEKHWPLCAYKDALPSSAAAFIWNDDSPFKQTGYWEASEPSYDSLLADFFSRKAFLWRYLKVSIKSGFAQMAKLSVGEGITPYNEASSPYKFLERAMPDKLPEYVAAKQFNREFSFDVEKVVLFVTMGLSVLTIAAIGIFRWRRFHPTLKGLTVVALVGYVLNAFLTGALANVYSRLQARIAWLIPLLAVMLVLETFAKRKS